MKRKLREAKSKVFGTKQVLTTMNKASHEEEHRTPTGTSPTVATYEAGFKWGFKEPETRAFEAFPVGSIFLCATSDNPSNLLGYGTWVQITASNPFLRAAGGTVSILGTGGSDSHSHSTTSAGAHSHAAHGTQSNIAAMGGQTVVNTTGHDDPGNHAHTASSVEDIPTYFAIAVWRRTA